MKQNTALAMLLAVTIAATGLMVFYNHVLRESFAVSVGYTFPVPAPASKPGSMPQAAKPDSDVAGDSAPIEEAPAATLQPDEAPSPGGVQFPLELNAATYDELLLIPQVGDVMAQRIIQYREHLGGYGDLSQLLEIKGIGEKVYYNITAYLYIEGDRGATSQEEEST